MDKQLFEREFNRARRMASIENNEYWSGYQRGLRRRFHGENFGTDKEHEVVDFNGQFEGRAEAAFR